MPAPLQPEATRPRDWRWLRCQSLVQQRRRICPRDDNWVRAGVQLFRHQVRCAGNPHRLSNLERRLPDLVAAHRIYAGQVPSQDALLLKLHLRAGTPFEVAAELTGWPTMVVRAHSQLFFAVPDQRPDRQHITWLVVCSSDFGAFLLDAALDHLCPHSDAAAGAMSLDRGIAAKLCTALWTKLVIAVTLSGSARRRLPRVAGALNELLDRPGTTAETTTAEYATEIQGLWGILEELQRVEPGADAKP